MNRKRFVLVGLSAVLAAALSLCVGCSCAKDDVQQPSGNTVSVTVAIESTVESQAFEAKSATVSVDAVATVYDALMATGWDVVAEDSDWGKYVRSIDGHADGTNWGWVYTENGESVMDGASSHVVVADATYTWQLISW